MTDEKFDELVDNITSFFYDWDPYEFKDIYQDYEMGLDDTREVLSSKKLTNDLISNIKNICKDIEDDMDESIRDIYTKGIKIVDSLNEYVSTLEDDIEL